MDSCPDPRSPVLVAARRTAITTAGAGLARVPVDRLAAATLSAVHTDLDRLLGASTPVDDVVLGNCTGPGGNVARVAALAAGLGQQVPGVTVDRQCGSGLEAVRLAAALVRSGSADVVLAGGAESASTAPWRLARPTSPTEPPRAYARAPFAPPEDGDPEMGEAAEALATSRGVSRQRQDTYAARSHVRALEARGRGLYDAELVAVGGVGEDDRPRRGLTTQTLSRFRPAFVEGGTVTVGNSCGINDGAAALAVVSEDIRASTGLPGLRLLGSAVAGVDPRLPGLGPVPAVLAVLDRAGVALADVGQLEITEAFAAQLLACTDALDLDPLGADAERVCPDGGAIALGHPWGASGALLLVRLFARMVRVNADDRSRYGLAACAIGGGQGIAVLVERVDGQ